MLVANRDVLGAVRELDGPVPRALPCALVLHGTLRWSCPGTPRRTCCGYGSRGGGVYVGVHTSGFLQSRGLATLLALVWLFVMPVLHVPFGLALFRMSVFARAALVASRALIASVACRLSLLMLGLFQRDR